MATTPAARLWALRADGVLLAFDYEPTQNTRAWSDHVLAGSCPDELGRQRGVEIFTRDDGEIIALFGDKWKLAFVEKEHPELTIEPLIAD